jgi:predicted thioesterase
MDDIETIKPGINREETFNVQSEHSAIVVGSGGVPVLATPWLIAFMERVAFQLLEENLPAGISSVGTDVSIQHKAPSPIGAEVRVSAEVLSVEGRRITISVRARDEQRLLAEGTHQRAIIDRARFLERITG